MSRYRRNYVEGGTYFFTVVTYMRRPLLDNRAVSLLEEKLNACISLKPFTIEAMVILPDHLHCIWTLPPTDHDYSSRWRTIKTSFTKEYIRRVGGAVAQPTCRAGEAPAQPTISMQKKGEKGIWQRRFWEHTIRDEKDYQIHFDYVHYNPVKHGLVKSPLDWPHSTFHRYVQEGIYPDSWGGPSENVPKDVGGE
jgi:putative transposase